MTLEQRQAARARCEVATDLSEIDVSEWVRVEDGELAAHARTDLLDALDALDKADAEVARLAAERDRLFDMTQELDQHPKYYEGPCKCRACREERSEIYD